MTEYSPILIAVCSCSLLSLQDYVGFVWYTVKSVRAIPFKNGGGVEVETLRVEVSIIQNIRVEGSLAVGLHSWVEFEIRSMGSY